MPRKLDISQPDFATEFEALFMGTRTDTLQSSVVESVAKILRDVRLRRDQAVIDYTLQFDHLALTPQSLRLSVREIEEAVAACTPTQLAALDVAASRITAFHARQQPESCDTIDKLGVRLGARWTPVDAVGLYVPGGTAAYPSSVLMNAIPAKVAGVERIVMVVPTPHGQINPLVLAAARRAGITEIYRIGGAQAVAALAYGTESIRRVDKIVGPGNAYVAEAKRQVFGVVGIDMIAGPSEILVVADSANDPEWIAADLLSQAEHDPDAQAILIADDAVFADAVCIALERQLSVLPRAEIARASWDRHGVVIVVRDIMTQVPGLVNAIAPEHLELAVTECEALMADIKHAGSIFLGRTTPEALGDYVAGPNHVLPTSRSARFSSGLNVLDFMKRTTFIACPPAGLAVIGPAAVTLAETEGLDAHARSVALRLKSVGS